MEITSIMFVLDFLFGKVTLNLTPGTSAHYPVMELWAVSESVHCGPASTPIIEREKQFQDYEVHQRPYTKHSQTVTNRYVAVDQVQICNQGMKP